MKRGMGMGRFRTLLITLACVALVLGMASCGSNNAPEQAVASFMQDLRDGERERVAAGLAPGTTLMLLLPADPAAQPGTTALLSFACSNLSYTVTGGVREGESATVEMDITVPDMTVLLQEYFREALLRTLVDAGGDLGTSLQTLLAEKVGAFSAQGPFELRTSHVVLALVKVDNHWKINDLGNLEIAVIGGFEQMFGSVTPAA